MPNIVQGNSLPGTATNRQIVAYVQELEDQLRYVLANLGAENMAPDAIKVETLAPDVRKVFQDTENNIGRVIASAKKIEARLQSAEGDISTLEQTTGAIETRVENAEGEITTLEQTTGTITTRVENAEGDITTLTQTANSIRLGVTDGENGVGQVHNSSLDINTDGISMNAGKISMEADTEMTIKSGGVLDIIAGGKGNISLTEGGGSVDAETGSFTYLNVNGKTVGGDAFFLPVRAAFTEDAISAPAGVETPYLWINATTGGGSTSETQISVAAPYWQDISHSYSGTFSIGTPANQLDGTEFSYKVSFGLTHRNSSMVNVRVVYIRISNGTNYVTLQKTVGGNHRAGDIMNINAEITGQTVNLFNGSALTAQIMFSGDSALNLRLLTSTNVPFLLTGKSNSGGGGGTGINDTSIKWVTA